MFKDINDNEIVLKEVVQLLKGMNAYINLISYNKTENIDFMPSEKESLVFDYFHKNGLTVTHRRSQGNDISAACGQLRANYEG
jgi:23S rRNA (adenine2503-C2)-methyltransferase